MVYLIYGYQNQINYKFYALLQHMYDHGKCFVKNGYILVKLIAQFNLCDDNTSRYSIL